MQPQSVVIPNADRFSNPFSWYAKMRHESPVYYDAEQQAQFEKVISRRI